MMKEADAATLQRASMQIWQVSYKLSASIEKAREMDAAADGRSKAYAVELVVNLALVFVGIVVGTPRRSACLRNVDVTSSDDNAPAMPE